MSTLAERLDRLDMAVGYHVGKWVKLKPELCAVVEAAEKRRKAGFTRPFSGFAQVEMNESLDELARRMDEEGL